MNKKSHELVFALGDVNYYVERYGDGFSLSVDASPIHRNVILDGTEKEIKNKLQEIEALSEHNFKKESMENE